jgi:hypothetical protein
VAVLAVLLIERPAPFDLRLGEGGRALRGGFASCDRRHNWNHGEEDRGTVRESEWIAHEHEESSGMLLD